MQILPLQQGIIYGPIRSRRLGLSLGINLMPTDYKLCSFNCVYCHYGFTDTHTADLSRNRSDIPTPEEVEKALEDRLKKDRKINFITFSGNGEPTLHPDFAEIARRVGKVRDKHVPDVRLAILSNSTGLGLPRVKEALSRLDMVIMKLDCGTRGMFLKINRPVKAIKYEDLVENLKTFNRIVIQSVFVGGKTTNTGLCEVEEWIEKIRDISPLGVQIYSLDRPSASADFEKVDGYILSKIAEQARQISGVEVEVF